MSTDKHDPRTFERFVKLNADGSVAAVSMVAVGSPEPDSGVFVKIEHLWDIAVDDVKVDPALLVTLKSRKDAKEEAAAAYALALSEHAIAERQLVDIFSTEAMKPKKADG